MYAFCLPSFQMKGKQKAFISTRSFVGFPLLIK